MKISGVFIFALVSRSPIDVSRPLSLLHHRALHLAPHRPSAARRRTLFPHRSSAVRRRPSFPPSRYPPPPLHLAPHRHSSPHTDPTVKGGIFAARGTSEKGTSVHSIHTTRVSSRDAQEQAVGRPAQARQVVSPEFQTVSLADFRFFYSSVDQAAAKQGGAGTPNALQGRTAARRQPGPDRRIRVGGSRYELRHTDDMRRARRQHHTGCLTHQ